MLKDFAQIYFWNKLSLAMIDSRFTGLEKYFQWDPYKSSLLPQCLRKYRKYFQNYYAPKSLGLIRYQ